MDLVFTRQPILSSSKEVRWYEFSVVHDEPSDLDEAVRRSKLAMITLRSLAEYGLNKAGDGKRVFIRVPMDAFMTNVFDMLNPSLSGYKVGPASAGAGKAIYAKALSSVEKLRLEEALICVDYRTIEQCPDIVQLADLVEFDVENVSKENVRRIRDVGKPVLISGIDSEGYLKKHEALADYLQGSFLAPWESLETVKLASFLRSTLLRLLVLMSTAQTPGEFARVIETDVGLSAKLLRFVNSAYFSLRKEIKSIEQACIYFGLKNIKNFIIVLAINDYASIENPNVWRRSLVRAKLMEELAKIKIPEHSSEAYLTGLFSLIEAILDVDVVVFLKEVNVDAKVIEAFTDSSSSLGKLLGIVSLVEKEEDSIRKTDVGEGLKILEDIAHSVGIQPENLLSIAKSSFIMADTVMSL